MLICTCFFQWVGIIQGHVHWCHPTAPYLGSSLPSRRKQPLVLVRRILRYKFLFTLHTYFVEYLTIWWLFHSIIWLLIQQLCKCTQSSGRMGVAAHRWSPTAIFPHTLPVGILLLSDPVVFVTLPTTSPVADVCTSGWPVSSQYPNSAAEFEVFVLGLEIISPAHPA